MEKDYAQKELLVLKTVDEMSRNSERGEVLASEVQQATGLSFTEFWEITVELYERKKYLGDASDEHIKLSPAGKEFLQGESNIPNNQSVRDIYNTHVYGSFNNMIGGQGNTQNVQMNVNPEFEKAISSIAELIDESSLTEFIKKDLLSTVEHIKQLQESEPSVKLVEHAKAKIDYLGFAVKGADIIIKVAPHLHTLYTYFDSLIRNPLH